MQEIWKDIKEYEQFYQISNYGNIKSLGRSVIYSNGKVAIYKEKIRKPSISEYRLIALSKNGKVRMIKISRLVANHFIEKPEGKNIVNHKDGNKHNDNYLNLEWCNHSENIIHAFDNNLSKKVNKISGVFFDKKRGKWASYLYRNNKNIFIGRFKSQEEAIKERSLRIEQNLY